MNLPIGGDNSFFLDLFSQYQRDPSSVPADWKLYFDSVPEDFATSCGSHPLADQMIDAYRQFGYRVARLDPLNLCAPDPALELERVVIEARRQSRQIVKVRIGHTIIERPIAEVVGFLTAIYASDIAIEGSHLPERAASWLYREFESEMLQPIDDGITARALEAVTLADEFETFIGTRYPTKKRFGLEGAEATTAFLNEILFKAAQADCHEVVMGGMHRGRLAVLATVLGKSLRTLVGEINEKNLPVDDHGFSGDVPYHLGLTETLAIHGRHLPVSLLPHPSHLTVVAAVAIGSARARQSLTRNKAEILPLLLHTDAAFSGQGLVSEMLQLGNLPGYTVGGSIHLIVNNQIGFTTTPVEGRTSPFCSDIAKAFGVPVLHVNADSPFTVAKAARVAFAWRREQARDIIIDLVCYRRNGHNELDEPRFTQPDIWQVVDRHPTVRKLVSDRLRLTHPELLAAADAAAATFRDRLSAAHHPTGVNEPEQQTTVWASDPEDQSVSMQKPVRTGVTLDRLIQVGRKTSTIAQTVNIHPKVRRFYEQRLSSIESGKDINFATAEALAFGTLLDDGFSIRLSGQDSVRGTFTQRHLAVHADNKRRIFPLEAACRGSRLEAINSPLSEYGVLSFEYGHSIARKDMLVMWEAQFGDFLNGAQIVVDQFITSAESKWRLTSGLVIALPHGLEGQGPDHSSARIERLLHLCADDNVLVVQPSTPANLFHVLRRQMKAPWRKPLFLLSPKSLLRRAECVSRIHDLADDSTFQPLLLDWSKKGGCRRVILCSGKIYFDLRKSLIEHSPEVALVRIEQLYPFPGEELRNVLATFPTADLVWCQEEPNNQGAWTFAREEILKCSSNSRAPRFAGRAAIAATAGGSTLRHELEQARIVKDALN